MDWMASVGVLAVAACAACDRGVAPTGEPAAAPAGVAAPATRAAAPRVRVEPAAVERVRPEAARAQVQAGAALLVCAYDDAKYPSARLEGSIPYSQLEARLPSLPSDQEIILYCA